MAKNQHWRVTGYDGTRKIYDRLIPKSLITQKQMRDALRSLAAKSGLTFDEILDCHTKKNKKVHCELLEVHVESEHGFFMSCGSDPHFTASVVDK